MYLILNKNIGLRSFVGVPKGYYIKGVFRMFGLSNEQYDFLSKCDAKHDLDTSNDFAFLSLLNETVKECNKDEYKLDDWQNKTYDNRYFPGINWMITGKCNYNCLHCFNAKDNERLQSEWTYEEGIDFLNQCRDCGINSFTITGGEPMLHKNFLDFIKAIYEREMFVQEINTNGYFLNQEILDNLKEIGCNALIKISFDGLGYHDWLRDFKGAEEIAINAIKLCIKNKFKVMVQMNVNKKNMDSVLKTLEFLDTLGVNVTRVIRTVESPRWKSTNDGAILPINEYYDFIYEILNEYLKKDHNMNVNVWQYSHIYSKHKKFLISTVYSTFEEYNDNLPLCKCARGLIAVGANGNLYPCHQLSGTYEVKKWFLGNAKKTKLKELLNGDTYYNEISTSCKDLLEHNSKCSKCKYFKACHGGCRAIAIVFTNDKLGSDVSCCYFYEHGYYEKLVELFESFGYENVAPIYGINKENSK